jgi:hypothetical protein
MLTCALGVRRQGLEPRTRWLRAGKQCTGDDAAGLSESTEEDSQFEQVVRMNEHHWARCGRPVSAEIVRKQLRVGAARARALTRAVRALNTAAVIRTETVALEGLRSACQTRSFHAGAMSGGGVKLPAICSISGSSATTQNGK